MSAPNNLYQGLIFIFILGSLLGCQRDAKYREEEGRLEISLEQAEIKDVREVVWRSGLIGDGKVTKGITIILKLPTLDKGLIRKISKEYKANSWLIRVRQRSLTKNEVVGQLDVPIVLPGTHSNFDSRIRRLKSITFKIYYSAAAFSGRLANLKCPPFGHRYKIGDLEIEKSEDYDKWMVLSESSRSSILKKSSSFSYSPVQLNGGNRLEGTYEIELGLINSGTGILSSRMQNISDKVVIGSEEEVALPECEEFKIPPPKSPDEHKDKVKQFNFGG